MNVADLLFHLTHRRRMYVLDDRYLTAVAFVVGFDSALDGRPFEGFHGWVCQRVLGRHSVLAWPYVIAYLEVPETLSGPCDLNGLDSDTQLRMIDQMLALIREFAEADEVSSR
ncbi:hypothetical protein ACPB67_02815 [Micromonospora taraxaci]|uniref:hypothetical protein n=1 Tax=Micromonospora taraxaci TaxID=1316803 RepID=UPI003C2CAF50